MNIRQVLNVINRKIQNRDKKAGLINATSPDGVGIVLHTYLGDIIFGVQELPDEVVLFSDDSGMRVSIPKSEFEG